MWFGLVVVQLMSGVMVDLVAVINIEKREKNCQIIDALLFGGKYARRWFIDSKVFKRKRQTGSGN